MGCDKCEKEPIRGAFLRWKYATIEIIACKEHWLEIRNVLSLAQRPEVGEQEITRKIIELGDWKIIEGEFFELGIKNLAQALLKTFEIREK